jgi:hypothetical protein
MRGVVYLVGGFIWTLLALLGFQIVMFHYQGPATTLPELNPNLIQGQHHEPIHSSPAPKHVRHP